MMENLGEEVLYNAAEGLEKALAEVDGEFIMGMQVELIIDNWNPYKVQAGRNLAVLGWSHGVTLWEDIWSVSQQREWTARQFEFKSLRGTEAAMALALGISGYELKEVVTQPQGIYATPDLTKESWDEWIRLMPQIRIQYALKQGVAGDEHYSDYGFADFSFVGEDDGEILYGRKAVLRYKGVDSPLELIKRTVVNQEGRMVGVEEVHIPGLAPMAIFADFSFAEDDSFVDAVEVEPRTVLLNIDRAYNHQTSELSLTTVVPGYEPISPNYEQDSDIGEAGPWTYCMDAIAGVEGEPEPMDNFADSSDRGGELLADRVYLLDPEITTPMVEGVSFSDYSRVGHPDFTIEALVDLKMFDELSSSYADDVFADEGFATSEDSSHIDRACRALVAAKAPNDRVLASFEVVRELTFNDELTESTRFGDWVPASL